MDNQKPWVFFDVDDVITDTSSEIERSLRRLTGIDLPVQTWDSHLFLVMYKLTGDDCIERMLKAWKEDQILERSKIYPEVKASMDRVSRENNVGMITARGWHDQGAMITQRLIEEHALPVSKLMVVDWRDSKAQVLAEKHPQGVRALVDDTFKHIHECHQMGIHTALMDRPWNQSYTAPGARVKNLDEFAQWVSELPAGPAKTPAKIHSPAIDRGLPGEREPQAPVAAVASRVVHKPLRMR